MRRLFCALFVVWGAFSLREGMAVVCDEDYIESIDIRTPESTNLLYRDIYGDSTNKLYLDFTDQIKTSCGYSHCVKSCPAGISTNSQGCCVYYDGNLYGYPYMYTSSSCDEITINPNWTLKIHIDYRCSGYDWILGGTSPYNSCYSYVTQQTAMCFDPIDDSSSCTNSGQTIYWDSTLEDMCKNFAKRYDNQATHYLISFENEENTYTQNNYKLVDDKCLTTGNYEPCEPNKDNKLGYVKQKCKRFYVKLTSCSNGSTTKTINWGSEDYIYVYFKSSENYIGMRKYTKTNITNYTKTYCEEVTKDDCYITETPKSGMDDFGNYWEYVKVEDDNNAGQCYYKAEEKYCQNPDSKPWCWK